MTPVFGLTADQRGNAQLMLADEGDEFGKAFLKAFGDMAIENFSESTGASFILLRATAGKAAKDYLKAAVTASSMDKIARKIIEKSPDKSVEAMKTARKAVADFVLGSADAPGMIQKLGWDGYFEELGEEVVGEVLRQAFGIAPPGLPSLEEASAMAVGFLLNPLALGFSAHNTAVQKAAKSRANLLKNEVEMLKAARETGIGVIPADKNAYAKRLEEVIIDMANEPSGIFGKMMHKVFTGPVARMEALEIYKAIAPTEENQSFVEKAGVQLFEGQDMYAPTEGMFLGFRIYVFYNRTFLKNYKVEFGFYS
jgi:hypothetical protein